MSRAWIAVAIFAKAFTLAQLIPSPNGVNLAPILGAQLAGQRSLIQPQVAAQLVQEQNPSHIADHRQGLSPLLEGQAEPAEGLA